MRPSNPALTIPVSIPGLLRRGSPVVLYVLDDKGAAVEARGVVLSVDSMSAVVAVEKGSGTIVHRLLIDLSLDLTDATGRAHATWWLAEHIDATTTDGRDHMALRGHAGIPLRECGVLWALDSPFGWTLTTWNLNYRWCFSHEHWPATTVVTALAHLDPYDPRTLPDGSRWVDAEAMRLVVLHVAEVAP